MPSGHVLPVGPAADLPCCPSRPSCSYPAAQPRSAVVSRRRSRRAGSLFVCRCSATTPAQLDSARLQENGVGKAQAGTCCCLHELSLFCFLQHVFDFETSCCTAHTSEAAASVLRSGRVKRETKETKVDVTISIDGTGRCKAQTPIHFLNHMLDVSTV